MYIATSTANLLQVHAAAAFFCRGRQCSFGCGQQRECSPAVCLLSSRLRRMKHFEGSAVSKYCGLEADAEAEVPFSKVHLWHRKEVVRKAQRMRSWVIILRKALWNEALERVSSKSSMACLEAATWESMAVGRHGHRRGPVVRSDQ